MSCEYVESVGGDYFRRKVANASRRLRVVNAERARLREELNRRLSGYELGTEKSYMQRIDMFKEGEGGPDREGEK